MELPYNSSKITSRQLGRLIKEFDLCWASPNGSTTVYLTNDPRIQEEINATKGNKRDACLLAIKTAHGQSVKQLAVACRFAEKNKITNEVLKEFALVASLENVDPSMPNKTVNQTEHRPKITDTTALGSDSWLACVARKVPRAEWGNQMQKQLWTKSGTNS